VKERPKTIKLTIKAVKEVISSDPISGIFYPVCKNILSFINIYEILIMGRLLDSIANYLRDHETFLLEELYVSAVFKNFLTLLALFFFTTLLSKLISHFDTRLSDFFWYSFLKKSMKKVSTLNLEDIEKPELQNLLFSVPSFCWANTWDTYKRVVNLTFHLIKLGSAGYIIATQMSVWGLAVLVLVIPEALFRFKYNIKIKEFRDANNEKRKYFQYLHRQSILLRNFPELRVDNIFEFFLKSFSRTAKPYFKGQNRIRVKRDIHAFFWSWFDGSLRRIVQIMLIPVAVVNRYTIGTFKYLFDYIDNYYNSSWSVIWNSMMLKSNALYVKDYFDLIEYKGFGDVVSGDQKLKSLKVPKVEFVNVSFKYPNSPSIALNNISFTINPGEKVAIVGHDNSGKSTLAKLICGLYRIGPGDILIDDISIKNLSRGELKDKISVVFENYIKYNFSLRKNIVVAEPQRDFNRRRYEEALEITSLSTWMEEENINDSQILGKLFSRGMGLSTGHWQRIAIARAIYRDRAILILDESFTQIDGFSRKPILKRLIKHRPNQTFINIIQDKTELDLFDKVIFIEKGKLKEITMNNTNNINNTEKDNE